VKAINVLQQKSIDGLILIGGDGTFGGGTLLSQESGIDVVGVPGTIDNDCNGTDYTIGFDTAVNTAVEAIDRIRDTATAHDRLFFVEVGLEGTLGGSGSTHNENIDNITIPVNISSLQEGGRKRRNLWGRFNFLVLYKVTFKYFVTLLEILRIVICWA
jgi:hypothetical protein